MKRLNGAAAALNQEVTHMVKVSARLVRPDSVGVEFDDERLIANAGLVLVATLSRRLGIESLVRTQLELAIVEYIAWFNNDRLHESLGDVSPSEFEALYVAQEV